MTIEAPSAPVRDWRGSVAKPDHPSSSKVAAIGNATDVKSAALSGKRRLGSVAGS
jgi:hypothetical protein